MVKFVDLFENEENPCRPWEFEKKNRRSTLYNYFFFCSMNNFNQRILENFYLLDVIESYVIEIEVKVIYGS